MAQSRTDPNPQPLLDKHALSSHVLADCWESALGYRPSDGNDTLLQHGVSRGQITKLLNAIRKAYDFAMDVNQLALDTPFDKTAQLLSPLLQGKNQNEDETEPVLWLSPGLGGIGLGELLLARDYKGPGVIRLLRYPLLEGISSAEDVGHAHIQAVLAQIFGKDGATSANNRRYGLLLAGMSLGAHVIQEVACQLERQDIAIERLILMHSVARPERRHLRGHDFKLFECRRPHDFIRWVEWKLAVNYRPILSIWSRLLAAIAACGLRELAFRANTGLSCAARLKVFSYSFPNKRYPGAINLLLPSGDGAPTDESAAWWPAFCDRFEAIRFPVAARFFINSANRPLVVAALADLVSETLEKRP